MTETEIKAAIYDQITVAEQHQEALRIIQQEILRLNKELVEVKKANV